MSCSAFGCYQRQSKVPAVSFFRFPFRDPARLRRWTWNVRRINWSPTESSRLCSMHFEEDQFFIDNKGKRRLKDTGVPTIFNFPPHMWKKKPPARTTRTSTKTVESDCPVSTSDPGPVAQLCSMLDKEAVTNTDNGGCGSIPSADPNNASVSQVTAEETDDVDSVLNDDDIVRLDANASGDSRTIILDHAYYVSSESRALLRSEANAVQDELVVAGSESPSTLKRQANEIYAQLVIVRKKLRSKCQQTRRLKSRLLSLKNLTKVLQKKLNAAEKQLKKLLQQSASNRGKDASKQLRCNHPDFCLTFPTKAKNCPSKKQPPHTAVIDTTSPLPPSPTGGCDLPPSTVTAGVFDLFNC